MDNNALKCFSFDYKNIIIDEIALNGLEGIGFDFLWKMVEKRMSAPVTSKIKNRFWNFIVNCDTITIYKLPKPLPRLEVLNRLDIIDDDTGYVTEPPDYLDGPYEYCPVKNEYGSCSNYKKRKLIPKKKLVGSVYADIEEKYGDHLVMVASLEERWKSLASHAPISLLAYLTPVHYCILELVGKSRENGQTSVGKTNLSKIYKESKFLFYNRTLLGSLDLIHVSRLSLIHNKRLGKALLLRLKRFHKPSTMTMPKTGRIHDIVEYLLKQPNYTARLDDVYTKGIMNFTHIKRLKKSDKRFIFDQSPQNKEPKSRSKKTITFVPPYEEGSDQSEEETQENPIESQYNVKIPLMRQAFECFLRAGLKGFTQYELTQVLNIEFYAARMICKIFKKRNLVRVFLEDKGRQRSKRYISVTATSDMDVKFEEEKKKFLEYSNEIKSYEETEHIKTEAETEPIEVPAKKMKLEEGAETSSQNLIDYKNYTKQVVEVSLIEGLNDKEDLSPLFRPTSKSPTLRQLKFVNGIFKILNEKKMVSGYNTLCNLVAKEINEAPMDTKRLKYLLQRLIGDKKLRLYKMLRPGRKDVHETLICAASVKPTDPALRNKYKELSTRAINNSKFLIPKVKSASEVNLAQYSYPKYMKLRKIHEFIMNFVYFEKPENRDSDLPEGFSSLVQLIPEFTVEFSLGNLSSSAMSAIPTKKITDETLKIRLREAPEDVSNAFILSSSLQFSIRTGIKILAMFGLLQLIKEDAPPYDENIVLSYIFYVNRHAKILNTTGAWPRRDVDEESIQKSYYFATFEDVERFWNDVFEISSRTTIELPSRPIKKIFSPVRRMDEVVSCDNGQRFGDGLGACGFDSMFYLEMPRFWSTFYFKQKKHSCQMSQMKSLAKNITIPKKEVIKKPTIKIPICRNKKKPLLKTKGAIKPLVKKKRSNPEPTIIWSPEEDNILMYCKIATSIMSPNNQPGSHKLRNLVAKDILMLNDPKKDGITCHKRASTLESNSKLMLERDCIVAELKHRKHLIQKYEGIFNIFRLQKCVSSVAKFLREGRKPMMELVYLISKLVKSKCYKRRSSCIALDFNDFQEHYILTTNPVNTTVTYNKTPEKCDTIISTIKEVIIFTLMASYRQELLTETADKIHNVLNTFPEAQLRLAIAQLRKCGAIAAKDKHFNNHLSKFNYKGTIVHTSYRIAVVYERKLINRFNSKFLVELFNYIDENPAADGLKGSPGLNCLICELLASDEIEIFSVNTPAVTNSSGDTVVEQLYATELETKFTLKAGTCGWRNNKNDMRLREIYKDLPKIEISSTKISTSDTEIIDEKIMLYLKQQKENGSTFKSLQAFTGFDTKTLCDKLSRLESENVIMLVGFQENILVLTEEIGPWTVEIEGTPHIPVPWLSFDGIRHDIFLTWASTVMNKIFDNPGLSMTHLAEVCEHLTPRSAQEICMFLEKYKSVYLKVIQFEEPGLFSNDETGPEMTEFHKYASMDSILVFPEKDALTRFSLVKKVILDNQPKKQTQSLMDLN